MSTLRIERRDGLAIVRFDKARGNAIDEPFVHDLRNAAGEVSRDGGVRGVLLASAHPKVFCPGLDLVGLVEYDRAAMRRFMGAFADAVQSLFALRKPVVAALNGHAVAGGCVIALTADVRVLRRGAQIGLNEVRVGVPLPWSVALLLKAAVPANALAEVALLGRNFADADAVRVGLVDALADAEGFEAACLARLAELSDKDPAALALTKAYLRAEALDAMRAQEAARQEEWLDCWFSPATRARIAEIVAGFSRK
jgi:enoyl-CoA hydratase